MKDIICPHCQTPFKPNWMDLIPRSSADKKGTRWYCPHCGGALLTPSLFDVWFMLVGLLNGAGVYWVLKRSIEQFVRPPMPFLLWLIPALAWLFCVFITFIIGNYFLFKWLNKPRQPDQ